MSELSSWLREADEEVLSLCRSAYPLGLTDHPRRFLRPGLPRTPLAFADLPCATETIGSWTLLRMVWATPKGYLWAEARNSEPPPGLPYVVLRATDSDAVFLPVELVDVMRALRSEGYREVEVDGVAALSREDLLAVRDTLDLSGSLAAVHALLALGVRPYGGLSGRFLWRV